GQFLAIAVRANLNAVPGGASSGLDITDLGQQAEVLEAAGQLVGIGDIAERGCLKHVASIGTGRGAAGCWLGSRLLSAFLLGIGCSDDCCNRIISGDTALGL